MRARRRQPRRLLPAQQNAAVSNQLLCSSPARFQLDVSRQPPLNFRRALGRFGNNHQMATRGATSRRAVYRSAQVSKCTGLATGQKLTRTAERKCGFWWPKDDSPVDNNSKKDEDVEIKYDSTKDLGDTTGVPYAKIDNEAKKKFENMESENVKKQDAGAEEGHNAELSVVMNTDNERKKRLYSTVLSMTPPSPVNTNPAGSTRPQKFTPGLIKLNPKMVFLARPRSKNSSKFEELEKQALEQYRPSDESIDTKFRELERQAEEQYSPSNSNTSCGSEHSASQGNHSSDQNKNHSQNNSRPKLLDSVVIYSQNFPDLNRKGRARSIANLKNVHTPPRGEKKEQTHRTHRTVKMAKLNTQRAASDTEYYEGQDLTLTVHKSPIKWKIQAKKRHLSFSVSDLSSDEEAAPIKDARLSKKNSHSKTKMFNHGAGDLQKSKLQ